MVDFADDTVFDKLIVGEKITPISSAGLFTPSGKASYPSVAYQLVVPAVVAGVPELALVVPPVPGGAGEVDPALAHRWAAQLVGKVASVKVRAHKPA